MLNATGGIRQPGKTRPRWRALIKRIFLVVLAFVLVLAVFTLLLGAKAKADLKPKYPPPGQMVDIGGYRLHLNCAGAGSPTVVIDAGPGRLVDQLELGPARCGKDDTRLHL